MKRLGKPVKVFGGFGYGNDYGQPCDVDVDARGRVFVAENKKGYNRVSVFSRDGEFERHVGGNGTGDGQFDDLFGLCVDSVHGRLLTVDRNLDRLQAFDAASGAFVGKLGSNGNGDNQFSSPYGVCADAFGNVVVVETRNHRVCVLSPVLRWSFAFGSDGCGNGQFRAPLRVCFADDTLLVCDWGNHRVQALRVHRKQAGGEITRLSFAAAFGSRGGGPRQFHCPMGICVDAATGCVFVADRVNLRLCVFDAQYRFLHSVAVPCPVGVCVQTTPSSGRSVLVTAYSMGEVRQFQLPGPTRRKGRG